MFHAIKTEKTSGLLGMFKAEPQLLEWSGEAQIKIPSIGWYAYFPEQYFLRAPSIFYL